MSAVFDFIKQEFERTNEEIKRDMPRDEGTAANSLRVEVVDNKVRSLGSKHIEYLDRGSGPWKDKSKWKSLGYKLEESGWADRHDRSAFGTAYNIAHYGSQIFQGKKKGIELDNKIEDLKQRLKQNLPGIIFKDLKKGWKGFSK